MNTSDWQDEALNTATDKAMNENRTTCILAQRDTAQHSYPCECGNTTSPFEACPNCEQRDKPRPRKAEGYAATHSSPRAMAKPRERSLYAGGGAEVNKPNITRAYIREYSDNGQITAYIEWSDGSRTEGKRTNPHILALLRRALNETGKVDYETW